MPLYTYICGKCGNEFDRFMPVDLRETSRCECGKMAVRKWTAPHVRTFPIKAVRLNGEEIR
jgi:putative FmdB family regulatory protein